MLSLARGSSDPELTISLAELRLSEMAARDGSSGWLSCTEVRLTYAFETVSLNTAAFGPVAILGSMAPALLRRLLAWRLPAQWSAEMVRRGHTSLKDRAATRVQAVARGQRTRKGAEGAGAAPGAAG